MASKEDVQAALHRVSRRLGREAGLVSVMVVEQPGQSDGWGLLVGLDPQLRPSFEGLPAEAEGVPLSYHHRQPIKLSEEELAELDEAIVAARASRLSPRA